MKTHSCHLEPSEPCPISNPIASSSQSLKQPPHSNHLKRRLHPRNILPNLLPPTKPLMLPPPLLLTPKPHPHQPKIPFPNTQKPEKNTTTHSLQQYATLPHPAHLFPSSLPHTAHPIFPKHAPSHTSPLALSIASLCTLNNPSLTLAAQTALPHTGVS